jgi:hypothetical protein
MSLHRYDVLDAYTLEELRRKYTRANAKGRVSLLKELYEQKQDNPIAFEIARMAVEDENVEIREWIAVHGRFLDYRQTRNEGRKDCVEFPEQNLEDRLKNDPEPFVRACLRENPTVFSGTGDFYWLPYFQQANHLERLALMRNPEVWSGKDLIKRIFDHENDELGISIEERKELIADFLTNKEALAMLQEYEPWPGEKFLPTLWN